jgi:hypothetical protein
MAGDVEQQDMDADAAFDAGFSDDQGTAMPPQVQQEEPQPQETAAEVPAPEPEPEFVQLTRAEYEQFRAGLSSVDEIKAQTQSQFNKAFGTIGGLKQAIDRVSQSGAVELSAEDFAELEEDYGSDLATKLRSSLQKALAKGRPVPQDAPQEPVQQSSQEPSRLEVIQAQLTDSRLDEVVDGDWRQEVSTDTFKQWMQKQPQDVQSLAASENVRDAAKMLRLYVKDKSAPPAPPPKPSQRQRVLQAAVNPSSRAVPTPAPKEDDPFDQGFRAVRG